MSYRFISSVCKLQTGSTNLTGNTSAQQIIQKQNEYVDVVCRRLVIFARKCLESITWTERPCYLQDAVNALPAHCISGCAHTSAKKHNVEPNDL